LSKKKSGGKSAGKSPVKQGVKTLKMGFEKRKTHIKRKHKKDTSSSPIDASLPRKCLILKRNKNGCFCHEGFSGGGKWRRGNFVGRER